MAIDIRGHKKCGEVIQIVNFYDHSSNKLIKKPVKFNLYNGNAYLVAVHEYVSEGHSFCNWQWFFVDEKHMRRCLGLMKRLDGGKENMFEDGEIRKVTLFDNCIDRKKIASIFAEAFDNITIEVKKNAKVKRAKAR